MKRAGRLRTIGVDLLDKLEFVSYATWLIIRTILLL